MFAPSVPIAAATPTSLPTAEIQDLPGSAPLPIPTRHVHANVAGVDTHVVCQLFTDRLVVLISQVGKIGTLLQASLAGPSGSAPGLGEEQVLAMLTEAASSDLDDEDFDPDATPAKPTESSPQAWFPPPLVSAANERHTVLVGTPPAGQGMLYNLIVSQVMSLILYQANGFAPTSPGSVRAGRWVRIPDHGPAGIVPPPLVVGLGLRPLPTTAVASNEDAEVAEMEFFASDNVEQEQERLWGILKLVSEARVW